MNSVGQQGQDSRSQALTVATTLSKSKMQRCFYNMRSILGVADTLKSVRISPSRSGRNGEKKDLSAIDKSLCLKGCNITNQKSLLHLLQCHCLCLIVPNMPPIAVSIILAAAEIFVVSLL